MQCHGCAPPLLLLLPDTKTRGAIFSMLVDEDKRPFRAHRNQLYYNIAQCITIQHGQCNGILPGENVASVAAVAVVFVGSKTEQDCGGRHLRGTFFHEEAFLPKWKKKYCRRV